VSEPISLIIQFDARVEWDGMEMEYESAVIEVDEAAPGGLTDGFVSFRVDTRRDSPLSGARISMPLGVLDKVVRHYIMERAATPAP
jgi:hypothetical protein